MRTSSPLPGILRWFEVVEKKVEELTPVRYACERIEDVNRQLNSLISQHSADIKKNVNPLSMRLQVSFLSVFRFLSIKFKLRTKN